MVSGSDGDRTGDRSRSLSVDRLDDGRVRVLTHEPPARHPACAGGRYRQPRTKIAPEQWPAVAAQAARDGYRPTAGAWGVSHPTVATIVRKVRAAPCAGG
jgi:hypothetical protein